MHSQKWFYIDIILPLLQKFVKKFVVRSLPKNNIIKMIKNR